MGWGNFNGTSKSGHSNHERRCNVRSEVEKEVFESSDDEIEISRRKSSHNQSATPSRGQSSNTLSIPVSTRLFLQAFEREDLEYTISHYQEALEDLFEWLEKMGHSFKGSKEDLYLLGYAFFSFSVLECLFEKKRFRFHGETDRELTMPMMAIAFLFMAVLLGYDKQVINAKLEELGQCFEYRSEYEGLVESILNRVKDIPPENLLQWFSGIGK